MDPLRWIGPEPGDRPASRRSDRGHPILRLALAVLASTLLPTPAAAQAVDAGARRVEWSATATAFAPVRQPERWEVFWTPYLWAAGVEGEVGSRGRTTEIDLGFSDVVQNLDGALLLPIELRKGRWGVLSELILIRLSDQSGTPGPLFGSVEVSADETLVQLLPLYRIVPQDPVAVDGLAGGRLWHLSAELDFTPGVLPGVVVEATERWIDPIIGTRIIADLGERWRVHGYGDLGGFGIGSDFTWQLIGTIGYEIGEGTVLRFGYRHLDVDFENEEDGFVFDAGTGGWVLGVTIRL
ncbi:MAG TPA: hypothetical protein VF212_10795 [Longimicrobiales bacterium]